MVNVIIIAIVAAIAAAIIWYMLRAKKQGQTCIGCPHGKQCAGSCSGCSGGCSCSK